jgi:protein SCO1/2
MTDTTISKGVLALVVTLTTMAGVIFYLQHEPAAGGDFTLQFRDRDWHFKTQSKQLNLLYFGYVKCPDVCPLTLSVLGQAFRALTPQELQKTQLVFVSVDAEHDTPVAVADYASQFFSAFIGLTGSAKALHKVVDKFHVGFMVELTPKSYLGYTISHSDRVFFVDRDGKVVEAMSRPRSYDQVLRTLRQLLEWTSSRGFDSVHERKAV